MLWELLTLGKSLLFTANFMILTLFFIFEQVFTFYQLITSVTLMRDPLKTAMGIWAPSIKIIIIIIIIIINHYYYHYYYF